jgi:hypothetical protein
MPSAIGLVLVLALVVFGVWIGLLLKTFQEYFQQQWKRSNNG